jgi:hypothetical protein
MNARWLDVCLASILFALCGTVALHAADGNADDAAQRKQLAGTWKGFAVEGKGEKPDTGPVKLELVILKRGQAAP